MPLFNTIEGQDPFLYILGYADPIKAIVGLNLLKQRQYYIKYDWSRLFKPKDLLCAIMTITAGVDLGSL